jgi:hypothetical protein
MDCFVAVAPRNDVVRPYLISKKLSDVIAGLTGRSSIPETPLLEPISRGVLDRPLSRAMTAVGCDSAFSRHDLPEVCLNFRPR